MLTRQQHRLLEFIKSYTARRGYAPSFDEMKAALDLRSKSGVHRLIIGLEERGFIKRLPHRSRAIMIVPQDEPTPAMIRAGGEALFDGSPEDWVENPGAIAARVFAAMQQARFE